MKTNLPKTNLPESNSPGTNLIGTRPITPIWTALLLLAYLIAAPALAHAQESSLRQITTTGQSQILVAPDEVVLTLGVETSDKNLTEAKNQNDTRVRAILALAATFSISPEHVQTDYFTIEPRYRDYNNTQSDFLGYYVRKTVVFTLKDVSKIDALTSAALEAGANYVHGLEFRTTELRKHRDAARAMAIRAAKEKAQALAAELEQGVGQPRNISEGYAGWQYSGSGWGGNGWNFAANNSAQNVASSNGGADTPEDGIALGQISVTASVTVTFDLI